MHGKIFFEVSANQGFTRQGFTRQGFTRQGFKRQGFTRQSVFVSPYIGRAQKTESYK
jgi:hypothetical protein